MNQVKKGWKKNKICMGLICFFAISLLFMVLLYPIQQLKPQNLTPIDKNFPSIGATASPTDYILRTPISYDVGGQSLNIFGDLSNLATEMNVMLFEQVFTGTTMGTTFVVFTFSTNGMVLDSLSKLCLNWETQVLGPAVIDCVETQVDVFIEIQGVNWTSIHTITSTEPSIGKHYGWGDFVIPQPFEDYIVGNQLRVRFELNQSFTSTNEWNHIFYIRWLILELQQNISRNIIPASDISVISPGVTTTGGIGALRLEDDVLFEVEYSTATAEAGVIQFIVKYDLGYYGVEAIRGVRFSHMDWIEVSGSGSATINAKIFLLGESSNTFLCYPRDSWQPVTPNIRHGTFLALGDLTVNQSVQLLFDIQYTLTDASTLNINIDWAQLCVVRNPNPIVITNLLSNTIYVEETMELNVTCLDGQAPIARITVGPWSESIGFASGSYQYSRYMGSANNYNISIVIEDAGGNLYSFSAGILQVVHRPISIALYLSEDSYSQQIDIFMTMQDLLTGTPLALYPFTKTILKNGIWFRQQNHQTNPSGIFLTSEGILDYLDWNYTVIIDTTETPIYEATSVQASIVLSDTTPYITIDETFYSEPLKASGDITLQYEVICQASLASLWLYKNGTPYTECPMALGINNFTFQDVAGTWEYLLYATSSRGHQGFSNSVIITINPLNTSITLDSLLNFDQHALLLEIDLVDELNRSCSNVSIIVTIYDFGVVFYRQDVTTGINGVLLLVHFDQYLDHSFSIEIASEMTEIYKSAILSEEGLSYDAYPLYSVVNVGVVVGLVGAGLSITKWRLRSRQS